MRIVGMVVTMRVTRTTRTARAIGLTRMQSFEVCRFWVVIS